MKIMLIIFCIVFLAVFWPYVIAFPYAIVKAICLIVSGRDNDPEWAERKEERISERAEKSRANRQRRKRFWSIPSSPKEFFR